KEKEQKTQNEATMAMLCKTSVITNIVRDTPKLGFNLGNFRELRIDSKKEFDISTDSALFMATLDPQKKIDFFCNVYSFNEPSQVLKKYGWCGNKFVSDIELYKEFRYLDGESSFEWRQGIKHDAVKVMVLHQENGSFVNDQNETAKLEDGLLYPFLKGSDLRRPIAPDSGARTIVTMKSIPDQTDYIENEYPQTWAYLELHSKDLDGRKSKIYSKMARFSIFGVGAYSFRPYKIAICSMYLEPKFSLVLPVYNKPVMLDDISYFLSFDSLNEALFTWLLLNTKDVSEFLSSVVFENSKRLYTKELLMRINFVKLAERRTFVELKKLFRILSANSDLEIELNEADYVNYVKTIRTDKEVFASPIMT
ncbi:MAG: hypothetical protein ACHQ1H_08210, partial [Nitrososphaerales archaeon]